MDRRPTVPDASASLRGVNPSPADPAPVMPSDGWGVIHLFLKAVQGGDATPVVNALRDFAAQDPQQVVTFSVLGAKADVGVMALSPDIDALDRLTKTILSGPVDAVDSFVSFTELSEYTTTEDDERARLEREGVEDINAALGEWRARMEVYREHRLHPRLPAKRVISFYPMAKTRLPEANWYSLSFEERKRLMLGHGRVGRAYAGRVLQLITGCTGIDDWEWGVTLLADDPSALKQIVYEMRFDPVSAVYGEFGPFWTGLVMEPDQAFARAGLR